MKYIKSLIQNLMGNEARSAAVSAPASRPAVSGADRRPAGPDSKQQFDAALELHRGGRLEEARALYLAILEAEPDRHDCLQLLGVTYSQSDEHERAVGFIDRAIERCPDNANYHSNRAVALQRLGRQEAALAGFETALSLQANHPAATIGRGNALLELGRWEDAAASYRVALAGRPDHAEALGNLGVALKALGQADAALAAFEQAIALKPEHADAWSNRGAALNEGDRLEPALASLDRALALQPDHVDAAFNSAVALQKGRHLGAALVAYELGLALRPDHAEAWLNRSAALLGLRRFDEALRSSERARLLQPESAEAFANRGNILLELWQPEAAVAAYVVAIMLKPDFVEAYVNLGMALQDLKGLALAVRYFSRADRLAPEHEFLPGKLLHAKMRLCDWSDLGPLLKRVTAGVAAGKPVISPFPLLSLTDDVALHRRCAEIWERTRRRPVRPAPLPRYRPPGERIRIGYYSADFQNHATSYLMAGLFEAHDKTMFELFAFSFGPNVQDAMRQRVSAAFDHFIEVGHLSDREVAQMSRELGIDIAVDLKGFTKDARSGIFAERCAPLQVSYLGYPGTMGADYIDYLIADEAVLPTTEHQHYAEKIVYLPNSYQPNDNTRPKPRPRYKRSSFGLPEKGFVFSCFNNSYKITPIMFACWMRILRQVPGSVLWLFEANADVSGYLRAEAEKHGVARSRLVFAGPLPLSEHLDRSGLADLFLDTLPYNGHTTASDALCAGVPVLTCLRQSFASRVAASLLNAVGLPEMIVPNLQIYERMAVQLAGDPAWLNGIRARLRINLPTRPLFNTVATTRALEAAYQAMLGRQSEGLPPEAITIFLPEKSPAP